MNARILMAANMLKVELDKAAQNTMESAQHIHQQPQPETFTKSKELLDKFCRKCGVIAASTCRVCRNGSRFIHSM